jgi:hypothetical protein
VWERECGSAPNMFGADFIRRFPRCQCASSFDDREVTADAVQQLLRANGRDY